MRNPHVPWIALGAVLLISGLVLMIPRHAQAVDKSVSVRVVNDSSEPVPVTLQGAAQIDTSAPVPVLDMDNGARQPFVSPISVHMAPFFSSVHTTVATVPAGERLVIETISMVGAELPTGEKFDVSITTTAAGATADYAVPMTMTFSTGTVDVYNAFQSGHVYADPNTSIVVNTRRFASAGDANVSGTISGYLVSLP